MGTVEWLDPLSWERIGRGRTFDFELEDSALIHCALDAGRRTGLDLDLLLCSRPSSRDERGLTLCEVRPFDGLSASGEWNFWLRARGLSPATKRFEPLAPPGWAAVFSLSGLVGLQHPSPGRGGMSSIGVVTRVGRLDPDNPGEYLEVRVHEQYGALFDALKAAIRRRVHP
jgi:hypothetical protein